MTSPPERIEVICPQCGHEYEDWWRPSINAGLDPEMAGDERYLQDATTTTCPNCGHREDLGGLIFGAQR